MVEVIAATIVVAASLLSKLALVVEPPPAMVGLDGRPTSQPERRLNSESVHERVQPDPPATLLPARLREGGEGHEGRTARPGLLLLEPVRRHALLPTGPRQVPPGDLRGAGLLRGQAQPPGNHGPA